MGSCRRRRWRISTPQQSGEDTAVNTVRGAFRTSVADWQAHVCRCTSGRRRRIIGHIVKKHLLPRFGDFADRGRHETAVQAYVARLVSDGYARSSVVQIHDLLSAVLRTRVK